MRRGKVVCLLLTLTLLLGGCNVIRTEAATGKKYCKVGSAVKYTVHQLGLSCDGMPAHEMEYEDYRQTLVDSGILAGEELSELNRYITRAETALLCSRIMEFRQEAEDSAQVDRILKYDRISDMETVPEEMRRAVARVYGAGIIIGVSDGKYTQSRTFKPDGKITQAGVRNVVQMSLGNRERRPMSPDGQLIRTTDLPFNACEYDYILASFPNSFYTPKFGYELSFYNRMPVSPKDYAAPADVKNSGGGEMVEEWKYEWAEKIRKNYERKLNFDYRTVDESWVTELAETYNSTFDEERNAEQTKKIRDWVKWAKKNEVVIESQIISVEPSMFYAGADLDVRCYIKFRVVSCKDFENNKNKVIFTGSNICKMDKVELNSWYGDIIANGVSWYTLTPTGDTAGIPPYDGFCPYGDKVNTIYKKTGLMQPVKLSDNNYGFDYIE